MGFLDSVEELESRTIIEGLVILVVAILVVTFIYAVCCHAKKKSDRRKKKEEEEATEFFSFHEALPDSHPKESLTFYKPTVFSLTGSPAYPGNPYYTLSQTPIAYPPVGGEGKAGSTAGGGQAVLLEQGQHVPTPIYPPSFFSSAPYDPAPRSGTSAPPPSPPPPYPK